MRDAPRAPMASRGPRFGDRGLRRAEGRVLVHGSLATRYRGRWTEGEDDLDIYEVVQVTVGDEHT